MSRLCVVPTAVPAAVVRRVSSTDEPVAVARQVEVRHVPAPHVVPRQIDRVGLRLLALQFENDALREQLEARQAATVSP